MSDFSLYIEWRKRENIYPLVLPNKEKFYDDIQNIEHSFSGRIDEVSVNTFIMEAAQLLVNAIELFEMGYFDCAYYSLRSAVDVSTTMVFLVDMPEAEENWYERWKNVKQFPMQNKMVKSLIDLGNVLSDMHQKMPSFFDKARELSQRLNKYVHKQGFHQFYVSRNHPLNQQNPRDRFIECFESDLKDCIGVVAVMRLAADPFPVLLMDGDFLNRFTNSLTEAYSDSFVEEYIGEDIINAYKNTAIYQDTYQYYICQEEKNEATFNVLYYQYIDTSKIGEIMSQKHMLSEIDITAVSLVNCCKKIVKVYAWHGLHWYFTDRKTNRKSQNLIGLSFKQFEANDSKYNQPYDEAYISVFRISGETYFVEHNETLEAEEITLLIYAMNENGNEN